MKNSGKGLYPIKIGDKKCYINTKGETILESPYDRTRGFTEGLAGVSDGNKYGFMDIQGNLKIGFLFDDIESFQNGYCPVKIGLLWGLIDHDGDFVIQPKYHRMTSVVDGLVGVDVERGRKSSFIDLNENIIIDDVGPRIIAPFSEGLTPCSNVELVNGYRNTKGEWHIEPAYTTARNFSEGLAGVTKKVKKSELAGFIDHSGNEVIPFKFEMTIATFSCGRAIASESRKRCLYWGAIDKTGEWIIEPKYDYLREFSENLAGFRLPDNPKKIGFMNTNAEIVIPAIYDHIMFPFEDGFAGVRNENGTFLINTDGVELFKF